MNNRVDQGQQIPLAGSRQREVLALFAPADPHEFSIRPSAPVFNSKRRLTGQSRRGHIGDQSMDVGRKFDCIGQDDRERSKAGKPKLLFKEFESQTKILLLRDAILLSHELLLKVRQGLKCAAEYDESCDHCTYQFEQTRARLAAHEKIIRQSAGIPVPRHEQPLLMSPRKGWIGSESGYSHLLLSIG